MKKLKNKKLLSRILSVVAITIVLATTLIIPTFAVEFPYDDITDAGSTPDDIARYWRLYDGLADQYRGVFSVPIYQDPEGGYIESLYQYVGYRGITNTPVLANGFAPTSIAPDNILWGAGDASYYFTKILMFPIANRESLDDYFDYFFYDDFTQVVFHYPEIEDEPFVIGLYGQNQSGGFNGYFLEMYYEYNENSGMYDFDKFYIVAPGVSQGQHDLTEFDLQFVFFGSLQSSSAPYVFRDAKVIYPQLYLGGAYVDIDDEAIKKVIEAEKEKAYKNGYEQGQLNSDNYKKGFNDATRTMSDQTFGENFLGNLFSAPLRALNSFTLITTPNGVDITLGGILAACIALIVFVAFLKLYAGG